MYDAFSFGREAEHSLGNKCIFLTIKPSCLIKQVRHNIAQDQLLASHHLHVLPVSFLPWTPLAPCGSHPVMQAVEIQEQQESQLCVKLHVRFLLQSMQTVILPYFPSFQYIKQPISNCSQELTLLAFHLRSSSESDISSRSAGSGKHTIILASALNFWQFMVFWDWNVFAKAYQFIPKPSS